MQFGGSLLAVIAYVAALATVGGAFALLRRMSSRSALERAVLRLSHGDMDEGSARNRTGLSPHVAQALDLIVDALHPGARLTEDEAGLKKLYADHHSPQNDAASPDAKILHVAIIGYERSSSMRRAFGSSFAGAITQALAVQATAEMPDAQIGRIGGASFELAFEAGSHDEALAKLTSLQQNLERPFSLEGHNLDLTVSIGAAPALPDDRDVGALTKRAEHAFSQTHAAQRIVIRDNESDPEQADHLFLLRELPEALAKDEIFIVYQPKLRLRTGQIDGVEALLRWQHPARGLVPPATFIPIAEQSGEIRDLTLWVLTRAIEDQKRLAAKDWHLWVHVNISGRLLTDNVFAREACALIGSTSASIGFEITETAIIDDPDAALANLNRFADMGIAISIDDYGAGLSSLSYLKQMPARELKIDKMFVSGMTSSHRDPLIVRSTIDLAHALEMDVTAEGVESPATLALLRVMGCDIAQGYLISPGVPIDELEHFLANNDYLNLEGETKPSLLRPASFWGGA